MQMARVETRAGTAICAEPSRIDCSNSLPASRLRLMFSMATVASSTRMPTDRKSTRLNSSHSLPPALPIWNGDLRRAVEDRLLQFLARLQIAVDVFDGHGGVVHQDADRSEEHTSELQSLPTPRSSDLERRSAPSRRGSIAPIPCPPPDCG